MALRMVEAMHRDRERAQSVEEKEKEKFDEWFKDVKPGEKVCDLVLMRHGNRFPGPTDWVNPLLARSPESTLHIGDSKELTPDGVKAAEAFGRNFTPYDRLFPYGSMERRAPETANNVVRGAGGETNLEAISFGDTTYVELMKKYPDLKGDFKKLSAEAAQARVNMPNWGLLDARERSRKGEEVEGPVFDKLLEVEGAVENTAQMMSGNILNLQEKARGLINGDLDKTAIPFVTHALLNEAWFLKVLRINGQPIKSLKELGGCFSPVEGFVIRFKKTLTGETKIECKFANPKRQALFADVEMTIDWGEVQNLAAQYAGSGEKKPEEPKKETIK